MNDEHVTKLTMSIESSERESPNPGEDAYRTGTAFMGTPFCQPAEIGYFAASNVDYGARPNLLPDCVTSS